jgi:hypothetical protein
MIIYLTKDFEPVEKEKAVMAKVIPENGDPPYFVAVEKEEKETEKDKS